MPLEGNFVTTHHKRFAAFAQVIPALGIYPKEVVRQVCNKKELIKGTMIWLYMEFYAGIENILNCFMEEFPLHVKEMKHVSNQLVECI